ncbi:hypothetical protein TNCT6_72100 [Streptomyces sp. 6-11-2]|nr:hypothetical protein TNCT6_72100 [Streptomyces sp. 6-11-2]
MGDAPMTSENVAGHEAAESAAAVTAAAVSAEAVDDQLIDELVSRAQAEGLQLTGEGGLLQQLTKYTVTVFYRTTAAPDGKPLGVTTAYINRTG